VKDEKERREISRRSFSILLSFGRLLLCLGHFGKQIIQGHIGEENFAFLGAISASSCKLTNLV
jgi:hypothetical protein